jgi:hypothetical protein
MQGRMGGLAVGRMGEMRVYTTFCSESLKERYRYENLGIRGRIILKLFLKMEGCRLQNMGTRGEHV